MKFNFKPKSELEKFGMKIYRALVENFPQTFFVGGMVRDLLLGKKVTDIDITTEAAPDQVVKVLSSAGIKFDLSNKNFGSIVAKQESYGVEITTFRKDLQAAGRYPKIKIVDSYLKDSKRRDFTINALYLNQKKRIILDPAKGKRDITDKKIKFIGNPEKRIKEDPLRILRALRFALSLNFKLENQSKAAIKNNFNSVQTLTSSRVKKELEKIKNKNQKNIFQKVINNPNLLDNYFK